MATASKGTPLASAAERNSQEYSIFLRKMHGPYGATELACILPGAPSTVVAGLFDDADAMVAACAEYSARGPIYYVLNPIRPSVDYPVTNRMQSGRRARKGDVAAISLLMVDVDVTTPGRKQAATKTNSKKAPCTDEEHDRAVAAATLFAQDSPEAWVIATNGAQVVVPVLVVGTSTELQAKAESNSRPYLREIQNWWKSFGSASDGIDIDVGMWDLPRLAAMPGTYKRDGQESRDRKHRQVSIVRRGTAQVSQRIADRLNAPVPAMDKAPRAARASSEPQHRAARASSEPQHRQPRAQQDGGRIEPLDGLCAGWNRVYTQEPAHPKEGRSAVLSGLTRCLRDNGFDGPDVVDLVLAHDDAVGQKLVGRADRIEYVERELASELGAPGCSFVLEVTGDATPCLGCPHYRASKQAPKSFPLKAIPDVPNEPARSLDEARAIIDGSIRQYLFSSVAPNEALLIAGPPGLGKTTLVVVIVGELIEAGKRAVLVVDRIELADQLAAAINKPGRVRVLRGMDQCESGHPMCLAPERRATVRAAGLVGLDGAVACHACPHAGECRYQAQFADTDSTWIMTAAMMPFRLRDGQFDNRPDFVVLDEGALGAHTSGKCEVTQVEVDMAVAAGLDVNFLREPMRNKGPGFPVRALIAIQRDGRPAQRVFELLRQANELNASTDAREHLRMVPLPIVELLVVIADTLRYPGPHPNSRLECDGTKVIIRNPRDLRTRSPTIVLDSTGVPAVYEQLLGRPIRYVAPFVRSNATVLQLTSGRYGRSALDRPSTRAQVLDVALKVLLEFAWLDEPVAVVLQKAYEQEFSGKIATPPVELFHYAATRGTNRVADIGCLHIILVGTYAPNLDDLVAWCRARAWQDPEPINGDFHEVLVHLPGTNLAVPVLHAVDPRVDAWLQMQGPGEMLQAAERLRSRIRPERLFVWILSNQPVPGLPPNHVSNDIAKLVRIARPFSEYKCVGGGSTQSAGRVGRLGLSGPTGDGARDTHEPPVRQGDGKKEKSGKRSKTDPHV